MSTRTADPFQIFQFAQQFHVATEVIADFALAPGRDDEAEQKVFAPIMVTGAFVIELLLKCLEAVEKNGQFTSGHHLGDLFRKLPEQVRREIVEDFDVHERPWLQERGETVLNFEERLDQAGDAFEKVRSVESSAPQVTHTWDSLLKAPILRAIMKRRPAWEKSVADLPPSSVRRVSKVFPTFHAPPTQPHRPVGECD